MIMKLSDFKIKQQTFQIHNYISDLKVEESKKNNEWRWKNC